jgi:hypothetical protein
LSKGGNVSPPFGKGRWGGILKVYFKQLNYYVMRNYLIILKEA